MFPSSFQPFHALFEALRAPSAFSKISNLHFNEMMADNGSFHLCREEKTVKNSGGTRSPNVIRLLTYIGCRLLIMK